ncbi:MAG: hypothetical protein ACLRLY_10795 [Clostridium sp.]
MKKKIAYGVTGLILDAFFVSDLYFDYNVQDNKGIFTECGFWNNYTKL